MSFGPEKILLIVVVLLLLFGARRIPELAGSMGKGIREFKRNLSGANEEGDKPSLGASQPGTNASVRETAPDAHPEPKRLIR